MRELLDHKKPEKGVTIYAGTGNNGGDGFVAARHLINQNIKVKLVLLGRARDVRNPPAQNNWEVLSQINDDKFEYYFIRDSTNFQKLPDLNSDVFVDAMLGTGIKGSPHEPVTSAIESLNTHDGYKAAVDIPTGIDPVTGEAHETASECDLTVTFHDSKPGIEKAPTKYTGEIVIVDIGVPKSAVNKAGPGDVRMSLSGRSVDSHKGENGRVLIVGGGSSYVGAPSLAGLACLRAGADLVTVAVPSRIADVVNSFSPDLITFRLPGEDLTRDALSKLNKKLGESTAVLIGPGLGEKEKTANAVSEFMEVLVDGYPDLPVLLDADGLKIVSEEPHLLRKGRCVVTPHSGEFEILSGSKLPEEQMERVEMVSETAKDLETPILLKSRPDVCASSEGDVILNDTGNPGMTVGGTGDVLSGIVSAFISQSSDLFPSAVAGAFINGLAGDICEEEKGYGFTASDVKDKIPTAISKAKEYW